MFCFILINKWYIFCLQLKFSDIIIAYNLEKRWKKLYDSSLIRAESLQPIKKKFAGMTTIEIEKFCAKVRTYPRSLFIYIVHTYKLLLLFCRCLTK